ncbi:MAG: hypothetical protein JW714_01315, partial [Candidatus Omnitrophica bacterium]|nr:hypothetical protein [Candidatus Omnitrophota bacterium]
MKKVPNSLSENARRVLEKRYLQKDEAGNVVETPDDMFQRVASNIAQAEKLYNQHADCAKVAQQFYEMISRLEFLPNSPTLMNAGRDLQQLSACFAREQQVLTNPGYKDIDQIKVGDKIVTSKGRIRKVSEVHRRKYNGNLYTVNIQGLIKPTLNVTEEHPVLAIKQEKLVCKRTRHN